MEVKTPMLVIEEEETVSDSSDDKDNKEKKETLREMLVLLTNWVFMMFAISNWLNFRKRLHVFEKCQIPLIVADPTIQIPR